MTWAPYDKRAELKKKSDTMKEASTTTTNNSNDYFLANLIQNCDFTEPIENGEFKIKRDIEAELDIFNNIFTEDVDFMFDKNNFTSFDKFWSVYGSKLPKLKHLSFILINIYQRQAP